MNSGNTHGFWSYQDIAYLSLIASIWTGGLAVASPGTGLLELAACVCIFIATIGAVMLPINWWAIPILVAGLAAFLVEMWKPARGIFLLLAIVLFSVGSVFLYGGSNGELAGVSWPVAVGASLGTGVFFWLVVRKTLLARSRPLSHDPASLIGKIGEARTEILDSGSVQVASELWSAQSATAIPAGERVRVTGRQGLILTVEKES